MFQTNVEINYVYRLSPAALAALANHLNQEESNRLSTLPRSASTTDSPSRLSTKLENAVHRNNLSLPVDDASSTKSTDSAKNTASLANSTGLVSPSMHSSLSNYQIVYDETIAL